ncbi:MAG: biotin/lipoyl-containing protein [Bacteroidota bacterium]
MKERSYKATVNGQFEFDNETVRTPLDIVPNGPNSFHILVNDRAYQAEVLEAHSAQKSFRIKLNGEIFDVQLADEYDQLVKALGLSTVSNRHANEIKAPMPGLVLDVLVEIGQEVEEGEGLVILEAMKMENIIKAAGKGKVKAIHIAKGKAVDKGTLLVEMES